MSNSPIHTNDQQNQSVVIQLPNQAINTVDEVTSPSYNSTAPLLQNNFVTTTHADQLNITPSKLTHRRAYSRQGSKYVVDEHSSDNTVHAFRYSSHDSYNGSQPIYDRSAVNSTNDRRKSGTKLLNVQGKLIPKGSIRRPVTHQHITVERNNSAYDIHNDTTVPHTASPRTLHKTHSLRALNRRDQYTTTQPKLTRQQQFADLMDSKHVTLFITFIVLFTIVIALLGFMSILDPNGTFASISDLVTSIFFAAEVAVRLIAYGPKRYFTSTLCLMDIGVSTLDWVSYVLQSSGLGQIVWLRILRAFRLTRITRVARLSDQTRSEEQVSIAKDDKARIVEYNVDRLFTVGYMTQLAGTVLAMPEMWIQAIFLLIFTSVFAIFVCDERCNKYSMAYDKTYEQCDSCVVGFDPESGLIFSSLVAFLIGLFDSMTFDRWWRIRVLLSQLHEEKNTCAQYISTYVPYDDTVSVEFKKQFVRYLNLSMSLFYKQASDDENYSGLVQRNVLTEHEWDLLENQDNQYNIVYMWTSCLLNKLAVNNRFLYPGTVVNVLHNSLAQQRSISGDIFVHLETQIPYTYTHLMTLIVKVHLLFTSCVSGTFTGHGLLDNQPALVLWGYLVILVSNTVLEGLLRIHVVLSDPFGLDACDFSIETFEEQLWDTTHQLLDSTNILPFDYSEMDGQKFSKVMHQHVKSYNDVDKFDHILTRQTSLESVHESEAEQEIQTPPRQHNNTLLSQQRQKHVNNSNNTSTDIATAHTTTLSDITNNHEMHDNTSIHQYTTDHLAVLHNRIQRIRKSGAEVDKVRIAGSE